MFKKILNFFTLIVLLQFSLNPAVASEEFNSYYRVFYRFFENGNSAVSHEISLVNQQPDIYISEYSINLFDQKIKNVKAWDNLGPLKINTTETGNSTIINLKFNEKVVGRGQTLSFILKYDVPNLAKKEGRIWKVILPKLSGETLPDEYSVNIEIPQWFGSLAFASPYPREIQKVGGSSNYHFQKEDLQNFGILLEFGSYQAFDFNLIYHLQNNEDKEVIKEITLPPDTSYQVVQYLKINPEPSLVYLDPDGNWLAQYTLKPQERTEIRASGKVKIFPSPVNINLPSESDLERYLKPRKYWEKDDEKIIKIASKFKNPKEIYDFIISTLQYNYEKVNSKRQRLGALNSLKFPKDALCLEFTDLFIALARASGIPAREIEGYAYTDNLKLRPLSLLQDILHAWPEYYDFQSGKWRMIDPTWGKTTGGFDYFNNFDMSHFSFVIHGGDSQIPLPPGSFKLPGEEGKNILIEYGQEFPEAKPNFEVYLKIDKTNLFRKELKGTLSIKNIGTTAVYNFPIYLTESKNLKTDFNIKKISHLLPYEKINIPIMATSIHPIYKNIDETIKVGIFDIVYPQKVSIKIIGIYPLAILTILILIILLVFLIYLKNKKRSILKINL